MSHFTVTVCLPEQRDTEKVEERLHDILAPWDENVSVAPHKNFEDGGAEDYWWVRAVRRGAEHHRNGTGVKPHYPDDPHGFKHYGSSKYPEDVQRAEFADDAQWAEKLGEHPTWETVVRLYNEKYHPDNALAIRGQVESDEPDDRLHFDEEAGRAYTWSIYNPESKWDWWVIGGRWRNSLHAKPGVQASALILSDPHYTERYLKPSDEVQKWADNKGLRCDGGPKGLLDFESMRAEAEVKAHCEFDRWLRVTEGTPHAHPWSHFYGLFQLGELTIDGAREKYRAQSRVQALDADEDLRWRDNAIEEFGLGREEYVATARRDAVPGYALITLDRQWMAPGRMGWFGASSDGPGEREAYKVMANKYLDELADDILIVQIDCHI